MDSHHHPDESLKNPPRVHPIETTATYSPPKSYAEFLRSRDQDEFDSALALYRDIDMMDDTLRAEQLLECRRFAWFTIHRQTGKVRVASNACRLRWCPICSKARYQLIRQEVRDYIVSVRSPKFLTLTMRHTDLPLANQIQALYRHFRLFRQHKLLKKKIRGGCWFFQVKKSEKTGEWHPHLHCLIDANYINKVALSVDWRMTTGDSFIVDIRRVKDEGTVADYVARYCSKACNLNSLEQEDAVTVYRSLHGRRLCGTWGSAHSINFRPRPIEDHADWFKFEYWIDVVSNRHSNATCRAVWKSFATGEALSKEMLDTIVKPSDLPNENDWTGYRPIDIRQLVFDEFL